MDPTLYSLTALEPVIIVELMILPSYVGVGPEIVVGTALMPVNGGKGLPEVVVIEDEEMLSLVCGPSSTFPMIVLVVSVKSPPFDVPFDSSKTPYCP